MGKVANPGCNCCGCTGRFVYGYTATSYVGSGSGNDGGFIYRTCLPLSTLKSCPAIPLALPCNGGGNPPIGDIDVDLTDELAFYSYIDLSGSVCIARIGLDGTGETKILSGLSKLIGSSLQRYFNSGAGPSLLTPLSLDTIAKRVYYSAPASPDADGNNAAIYSSDYNGAGVVQVVTDQFEDCACGLVVDPVAGSVFWTEGHGSSGGTVEPLARIRSASTGGGGGTTLADQNGNPAWLTPLHDLNFPYFLTLDCDHASSTLFVCYDVQVVYSSSAGNPFLGPLRGVGMLPYGGGFPTFFSPPFGGYDLATDPVNDDILTGGGSFSYTGTEDDAGGSYAGVRCAVGR